MKTKKIIEEPTINDSKDFIGKINWKQFFVLFLIIISISSIGVSYHFYGKYNAIKTNPGLEAKEETDALISNVDKLIELPKEEMPTIATILDKEKLKDQLFFKSAENGDKLLVYNVAMMAFLYRPSAHKMINVAPITIDQSENLTP